MMKIRSLPYPTNPVERPLTLPEGIWELGGGIGYIRWEGSSSTLSPILFLRYGFTDNLEFYLGGILILLYIDRELPPPDKEKSESFQQESLKTIEGLVNASRGRALILFTSYNHLNFAAKNIRIDYPFKAQGDIPPARLIEWFPPHSRRWRWCIRLTRCRGSSGTSNYSIKPSYTSSSSQARSVQFFSSVATYPEPD